MDTVSHYIYIYISFHLWILNELQVYTPLFELIHLPHVLHLAAQLDQLLELA